MNVFRFKINWRVFKWILVVTILYHVFAMVYLYSNIADIEEVMPPVYTDCKDNGTVDYLGEHLTIKYTSVGNFAGYYGRLELRNEGPISVNNNEWEIYFCSLMLWEPYVLGKGRPNDGAEIGTSKIKVYHINGCLHKLKPMANFTGLPSFATVVLVFRTGFWIVSRSYVMPRWYVTGGLNKACTIKATDRESLDFVSDFTSPNQWKRNRVDKFNPPTPQLRFKKAVSDNKGKDLKAIIPTPAQSITSVNHNTIDITTDKWIVVYDDKDLTKETNLLATKLGMKVLLNTDIPESHYIYVRIGKVEYGSSSNEEAYELSIISAPVIIITGTSATGVFYGIQSLLSMAAVNPKSLPETSIIDYPRFPYRGMHLDVSRNFLQKDAVLRMLDVMAMYKLNKFHFHLTDDEGWRLEIPGLPEATQLGARQCFDINETRCIMSQFGSGPYDTTSGSGYYTVNEYKEILQHAADRHIQVIPEFDMPGHSHAIIKAMQLRYHRYKQKNPNKSVEFLLTDPHDMSEYSSIQMYNDNVINPCIESTYTFINYVVLQIKSIHQEIQPLKVFNFGGDEVPNGVWQDSPQCKQFIDSQDGKIQLTKPDLAEYFSFRTGAIAHNEGLDVAGWEEAFAPNKDNTYSRRSFPNKNAYVYAWNNVWEWGGAKKAYNFANNNYKVILSHATHLYFDHPQEPDPEERGLLWAARYIDTYKTFSFQPDDIYKNMDFKLMGDPVVREEVCDTPEACPKLLESKRRNVIGMQGQVWSETLRTTAHFESMMYPRLLALAERAWHKTDWEQTDDEDYSKEAKAEDWEMFANTLGYKELARLDKLGVEYYIPPPGARIIQNNGASILEANVQFPGLHIIYSRDEQRTWMVYTEPVELSSDDKTVFLKIKFV